MYCRRICLRKNFKAKIIHIIVFGRNSWLDRRYNKKYFDEIVFVIN